MSARRDGWRRLVISDCTTVGEVRHLRLAAADGEPLAAYTPGSHIVVEAGDRTNAYSLTGDFIAPDVYEISVLRIADGRGGSRRLHELEPGAELDAAAPRSAFAPVAAARRHLLIAGGIGVTPILSHVRAARLYGRDFEVVYGHSAGRHGDLTDRLSALCRPEQLRTVSEPAEMMAVVSERLASQPLGTFAYVCGPLAMMDAVVAAARQLGWPAERILTEAFSTAALEPGEPFVARLTRSGRSLQVPSGVSLLEALEAAGVEVPNLCRQGVCGECRLELTGGRPLHRDLYLSEEEHKSETCMMACVSRAQSDVLELAL